MNNVTKKTINTDKLINTESANLKIITEKANSGKRDLKLLNEYVCQLLHVIITKKLELTNQLVFFL